MKSWEFQITLGLALIAFALTITVIVAGQGNRGLQEELTKQQLEISTAVRLQQTGQSIVRDLAQASLNNDRIKDLLAKHGINVSANR
jgi:ABC-type lipoprotein release transport system permease subunit